MPYPLSDRGGSLLHLSFFFALVTSSSPTSAVFICRSLLIIFGLFCSIGCASMFVPHCFLVRYSARASAFLLRGTLLPSRSFIP